MQRAARILGGSLLLLLLGAAIAYGIARSGLQELDQEARDRIGGSFLSTDRGVLSYTRQGPTDAPTVILVHGFSTPKFVWEQITPTLLAAGYQVITYDHFGRGFSDRPAGPYNSELYRSELSAIIAGLKLTTPLALVGYSMGGANVVDYAASHPERIEQLVLIAPAGYMRNTNSLWVLKTPILGEWLFTLFSKRATFADLKAEVKAGRAPTKMLQQFEEQALYKGYTEALLSTVRDYPMADLAHRYRLVANAGIPVAAIWGTADQIVPYEGAALMSADVPALQLTTVEGANHNLTFTQPKLVASALLKALKANSR